MQNDYSKPQRQSAIGVLVMFGDALQSIGRAFLPFILVWVVKFREGNQWVFILGLLFFLILIAVVAYLRYLNFTFYLDDENQEFILTEGILSKTKTVVKVSKIQKVDIKQSLLQRIIGVHALEIDTAGTNKEEVSIKAISHDLALDLKEKLLGARMTTAVTEDGTITESTIDEEQPFVKISLGSLVKMGFTAHYVRSFLLMFAFIMSVYDSLHKVMDEITFDTGKFDSYMEQASYPELVSVFLLLFIVVILLVNVFQTVFRFFNYTITKQRDSLLLSFGLLNTKNTLIRPERVQFVSVTQNFFQRKLDILELKIRQATGGEQEQRKTAIEVPGCNAYERDEIIKLLFKEIPQKGLMLKPNWRKLGFSLFLLLVLPLGIYWLVRDSNPEVAEADYFIPFYVIIVIILQYFKFRNNRLFAGDRFVIRQSGAWDIKNEIVSINKIQGITTSQLFWHKNLNIGSLTLHTAGGDISFQLGNFEIIRQYANQWLYEIEISGSNWM